jgi:quinol monooxygenase YgiN
MIVEYIRYAIAHDDADAVPAAYTDAAAALDAAPECVAYGLFRGPEQPENWILKHDERTAVAT